MFLKMVRNLSLALGLGMIPFNSATHAADAEQHAAAIAPYCDDQTILVAHLDMNRVAIDEAVALLTQLVPIQPPEQKKIEMAKMAANAWLGAFRKVGGRDVYAVISLSDIGRDGAPNVPFFLVVPIIADAKADVLAAAIPTSGAKNSPLQVVARIPDDGPLLFGSRVTIERLKALHASRGAARPQPAGRLAEAFAAVDRAALQIVFTPTDDHRRVIREMFPTLPKPLDAIDGPTLADGILWKAVGIDLPPQFTVRSIVHAKDPAAAKRLAAGWNQLLDFATSQPTIREHVPMIDQIVSLLQPTVDGDNVVVTMTQDAVEPIVKRMLMPAVTAARSAASRKERMNQFKHLALAMHNWAGTHGKKVKGKRRTSAFPPAAIYGEDGKPLLSWRVAVLPFLEQQALYDQFHLDEPWDSEHNKRLIEKMPGVFKDRELDSTLSKERLAPGYTTYVVPVGEGLVFGRKEGTTLKEITDGTSNTIMIVEVVPEFAVPWTKPADWKVETITRDPAFQITRGDPLKGIKRTDRNVFTTAFCDGSVRTISNDIDPSMFWRLLTRDGGEVASER